MGEVNSVREVEPDRVERASMSVSKGAVGAGAVVDIVLAVCWREGCSLEVSSGSFGVLVIVVGSRGGDGMVV